MIGEGAGISGGDQFIDQLGDADPGVRLRAVLQLGEGRVEAAAAPLVHRFGLERDFQIREALTWAVLRVEACSRALVLDSLHSPRWLARLQAVHTLSKLGRFEDGAAILPLIADPIDAVAARAYWAAAQTRNPVTVPALVGELARGDSAHRNSLTVALSAFGALAVPAIVLALQHGAPDARAHAADTLGRIGSPESDAAEPALTDAVRDADGEVRLAALNALGQLELPAAWWTIDAATRSPEPRLRHLAERLTERRPPGPKFEPLITCRGGAAAQEVAPALELQVRVSRPRYLSRDDVPASTLNQIRDKAYAIARNDGRAESVAAAVAEGRVEQFIHETVLLEQVSVADPTCLVKDLLYGKGVRITGFARLDPDTT
jgi:hypothetical protein